MNINTNSNIRYIHKLTKFVIMINSKMHKFKTNNKIIDNLIYKNEYYKAIDKTLWNLNIYQACCYKKLLF